MQDIRGMCLSVLLSSFLIVPAAMADDDDDDDREICRGEAAPILTVSDFDGNGLVDENDILLLKNTKKREIYYAFYDINVDGKIDRRDLRYAQSDLGKSSTFLDQQLARLFHRTKQFQLVDGNVEIAAMGYIKFAEALSGHGEHWSDITTEHRPGFLTPNGLNVAASDQKAMGLYWGIDAIPVFENGATDYPNSGGEWMDSRVIAFAGHPQKFTGSPDEKWHTHAGLCFTVEMGESQAKIVLNQHTTFMQCQSLPTLVKTAGDYNLWANIWMLHAWVFDLNPNGVFANTHPCADPNAPAEESINGGREVPEFFQHHHG